MVPDVNFKDLGFKVLWTAVSAVLGLLAVELADVDWVFAPVAIAGVNAALAFVRQKLGATPPDAPATGAFTKE